MLTETDKYKLSIYNIKEKLHSSRNCDIYIVQSSVNNKLYIKRVYKNSNMIELFTKIKNKKVRNTPEIYEIFYDGKNTVIIEKYILGYTADSINFTKTLLFKTIYSILSSVEDLHSINIIHRDIKPSNIIITEDHKAYLIDFGIARFYSDTVDSDTTKSGTKGFASPEQYGFRQTDFRSDIYSIGKTIEAILKSNNINCNLKRIISKATSFDPKDRYASVAELRKSIITNRFAPLLAAFFILIWGLIAVIYFSLSYKQNLPVNETEPSSYPDVFSTTSTSITDITSEVTTQTSMSESTSTDSTGNSSTEITTARSTVSDKKQTVNLNNQAEQTTQQTVVNSSEIPSETTDNNVNILKYGTDGLYFTGLNAPDGTPVMEMLGNETHKTCSININNTYVTVECIKNGSDLTVNFSDEKGHKDSLSISYTPEELERSDFPDDHSFNAYVSFIDFDADGNTDIFVNFTDYAQLFNDDGTPNSIYGSEPYVLHNWNKLMLIEHTAENGFYIYKEVMKTYAGWTFTVGGNYRSINCNENLTYFKPENGVLVEHYPTENLQ